MPLAKPGQAIPTVEKPAVVENVGSSEGIREGRETERVRGQIRTHLVAHAMPALLSTVDLMDAEKVKALISEYVKFVETGK